eukprot:TRINITY_DN15285_c0_g1_i2.p1 TRINITY_DN15285_c0_g1~~TRINITY_DN15285_c0_g1_i2.p1  ORF type:complete len:530 (-),score=119.23 TRINITY_DN15285_c0_g1_i2:290-1789(-)
MATRRGSYRPRQEDAMRRKAAAAGAEEAYTSTKMAQDVKVKESRRKTAEDRARLSRNVPEEASKLATAVYSRDFLLTVRVQMEQLQASSIESDSTPATTVASDSDSSSVTDDTPSADLSMESGRSLGLSARTSKEVSSGRLSTLRVQPIPDKASSALNAGASEFVPAAPAATADEGSDAAATAVAEAIATEVREQIEYYLSFGGALEDPYLRSLAHEDGWISLYDLVQLPLLLLLCADASTAAAACMGSSNIELSLDGLYVRPVRDAAAHSVSSDVVTPDAVFEALGLSTPSPKLPCKVAATQKTASKRAAPPGLDPRAKAFMPDAPSASSPSLPDPVYVEIGADAAAAPLLVEDADAAENTAAATGPTSAEAPAAAERSTARQGSRAKNGDSRGALQSQQQRRRPPEPCAPAPQPVGPVKASALAEADVESIPPPPPPPALPDVVVMASKGSLNHPNGCGPACKYVRKGRGCKDGENCTHCHFCIWKASSRGVRKKPE